MIFLPIHKRSHKPSEPTRSFSTDLWNGVVVVVFCSLLFVLVVNSLGPVTKTVPIIIIDRVLLTTFFAPLLLIRCCCMWLPSNSRPVVLVASLVLLTIFGEFFGKLGHTTRACRGRVPHAH